MTIQTATGLRRQAVGTTLALLVLGGCAAAHSAAPSTLSTEQPTPAATVASTPTMGPTTQPTAIAVVPEFEWQQIGTFATEGDPLGMAASPAGYAVLRVDGVWFSTDGSAWTKATLPFEKPSSEGEPLGAYANAIAGGPNGFVVVGGQSVKPCDHVNEGAGGPPPCMVTAISWASPDGITWTSSLPAPIPATGARLPDYTELVAIWPAGDGWDAAAEARASVMYSGNALLHSDDGLVWTSRKAAPLPNGVGFAREVNAHGGVTSGTGTLLLWQYSETTAGIATPQTTLWSRADDNAWAAVPFDGTAASVRFALAPEGSGTGPWLLIGDSPVARAGTWWKTDDLTKWQSGSISTTGAPMQVLFALGRWNNGYMVLGSTDAETSPGRPTTFLSDDGMSWRPTGFLELAPLDAPFVMAQGLAGLVGVGWSEGSAAVWRGVDPRP